MEDIRNKLFDVSHSRFECKRKMAIIFSSGFLLPRSEVPRDEFGFYGWTEDFGPDSIVNLALRFHSIIKVPIIIQCGF